MREKVVLDGLLQGVLVCSVGGLTDNVVLEYPASRIKPPTHKVELRWDRARHGYVQHSVKELK